MKFGDERRYMELSLSHQQPTQEQLVDIDHLRADARDFLNTILTRCPESPERVVAFRKLEECVMYAVKSIVLEGK